MLSRNAWLRWVQLAVGRSRFRLVGILTLGLGVGVFLLSMQPAKGIVEERDSHSWPSSGAGQTRVVSALGRLEPGDGVVNLSAPEGLRVQSLRVTANQAVRAGSCWGAWKTPRRCARSWTMPRST